MYALKNISNKERERERERKREREVQTIKSYFTKATDPYMAILTYRSTPLSNGYSPEDFICGRKL